MPLYRPSELMDFLQSIGVTPKRSLSQNFLIDGNVLQKMISLAHPDVGTTVIEIGPGPGVLTEALLKRGCRVIAIERDHMFAQALSRFDPEAKLLTVIEGDIRAASLDGLLETTGIVIANIPYHISSEIIELILTSKNVKQATLLVQEEVGRRLVATAKSKEYDLLSVICHYFAEPHLAFSVPKNCFYPSPNVHSCVVQLQMRKRFEAIDEDAFFRAVTLSFQHRRKMVKTILKEIYDEEKIVSVFTGDLEAIRPDELSCEEWVQLLEMLER